MSQLLYSFVISPCIPKRNTLFSSYFFSCFGGIIMQGCWPWPASWAPTVKQRQPFPLQARSSSDLWTTAAALVVTSEPHPRKGLLGVSVVSAHQCIIPVGALGMSGKGWHEVMFSLHSMLQNGDIFVYMAGRKTACCAKNRMRVNPV